VQVVVAAMPGPLSWVVQVVAVDPGELLEISMHAAQPRAASTMSTRQVLKNVSFPITDYSKHRSKQPRQPLLLVLRRSRGLHGAAGTIGHLLPASRRDIGSGRLRAGFTGSGGAADESEAERLGLAAGADWAVGRLRGVKASGSDQRNGSGEQVVGRFHFFDDSIFRIQLPGLS
jgi:hypothetical protein